MRQTISTRSLQYGVGLLLLIAAGCANNDPLNETMNTESQTDESSLQSIVLGGGCFWCTEAVYQRVEGVRKVTSGYAGGHTTDPTYEQVISGTTGHAEVVQVLFDPAVITLTQVLDVFWQAHDPTTLNRQGADVGTQYRSVILYTSEEEETVIRQSLVRLAQSGLYTDPIVTEVAALSTFYPAEAYHHDYFNRNPDAGYCRFVILPKLQKLELK